MRNREQIRALTALEAAKGKKVAGKEGGEVVKKIPPLVMNHGLLATGAYAFAEKGGFKEVMDAMAKHLGHEEIGLLPKAEADKGVEGLLEYLVKGDSARLRLLTAEAMAWLAYARRFIEK